MARIYGWLWWIIAFGRRRAWMARRDHRNVAFLAYTALAALGDVIAAVWSLSMVLALVALGEWVLAGIAAVFLSCLMMRRVMIEHVTVPLGLYRTTYLLAEIDRWFMNEPLGVARLSAARAMARAAVPEKGEAWWKSVQPGRIGAYEIAAAAVIADARGDRTDARSLFESLALLREPAPSAREIAAEWLALDDAKAGRWEAIVERAAAMARPGRGVHRKPEAIEAEHAKKAAAYGEMLWPATGLTFFLEGVAGRMLGRDDAPSQMGLAVRWMESRRRREMWPVMKKAMETSTMGATSPLPSPSTSTTTTTTTTTTTATSRSTSLARAIDAHTSAVATPDEVGLAAAAKAWDAAFADHEWRFGIAQRAISLGAPSDAASHAVEEMRLQVVGDVATAILGAGVSLPGLIARGGESGVLAAAAARARAELLARLELSFERIGGRVQEHVAIAPIDEWRTFLAVRAAYTEAARQGGLELERLAFPHAHSELTGWSVWMWNDRKEHAISHGMTTWLLERALAVGDAQAIELHGKNAQLEPPAEA